MTRTDTFFRSCSRRSNQLRKPRRTSRPKRSRRHSRKKAARLARRPAGHDFHCTVCTRVQLAAFSFLSCPASICMNYSAYQVRRVGSAGLQNEAEYINPISNSMESYFIHFLSCVAGCVRGVPLSPKFNRRALRFRNSFLRNGPLDMRALGTLQARNLSNKRARTIQKCV